MKKTKQSPTRSKSVRRNGHAGNDTNRRKGGKPSQCPRRHLSAWPRKFAVSKPMKIDPKGRPLLLGSRKKHKITMKTQINKATSSTANALEGQPSADTNYVWKSKMPICTYSRKQALADGLQKEVPPEYLQRMLMDWDMLLPRRVFLTKKVIESCQIPDCPISRDEKGPLWEILNVLDVAIGSSFEDRNALPVSFGENAPFVWLHALWSTADLDDPIPTITIMMPDED